MFACIHLKKYIKLWKKAHYYMVIIMILVILFSINMQYNYGYNSKLVMNITRTIAKGLNMTRFLNASFEATSKRSTVRYGANIVDMKYILLWTKDTATPFSYFGKGQSVFINKKCQWTNCYITNDRNYLGFYTEFDVIAFNGPQLNSLLDIHDIPRKRSVHQKYVYANIEAADNYPVAKHSWYNFFNWTWTYRLSSDALWGYLAVRNATRHVVGPSLNARWMTLDDMQPIDAEFKESLKSKTEAAAWFSSNCFTVSKRENFIDAIKKEMHKLNLNLDIYGSCGKHQCPKEIMDRCLKVLQKRYYFFFAFENALNEDYVTEKIVYALQHNTVPVVYGGADYFRFMPDGIYLDASDLGAKDLAKKMQYLINNETEYHNMFRWKNHYSFHFRNESPDTDDYCNFCALINNEKLVRNTTVYKDMHSWWSTF